jgi:RNA polymerase sigma-70 factor (ECF subfamily)
MMADDRSGGPAIAPEPLDLLADRVRSALARGDRASACDAFEPIVGRLQRRAARIAYWYLRDAADADDAVQDAFLKTFERIDSYRPEQPFDAWFLRVVVNGCLDRLKARARRGRWLLPWDSSGAAGRGSSDAGPSPEARLLASEQERELREAIGRLPERQRAVLVLSQLEGLSGPEIGELTGLSESTVRVHLFRALRRLRGVLEETTGALPRDGVQGRVRR